MTGRKVAGIIRIRPGMANVEFRRGNEPLEDTIARLGRRMALRPLWERTRSAWLKKREIREAVRRITNEELLRRIAGNAQDMEIRITALNRMNELGIGWTEIARDITREERDDSQKDG